MIPLRPLIPFPALVIENSTRVLVVADLHIGWEWDTRFIQAGLYIPSQTHKLQARLLQIITEYEPDHLIFLGDVKQAITRIGMEEWRIIPKFFETLQRHVKDISVILGNHDGELEPLTPSSIHIVPSSGLSIGNTPRIGLFHGHAWPSPTVLSAEILIMGHIHPVVWFRDKLGLWTVQQAWVKTTCAGERLARAYLKYLNIRCRGPPQEAVQERVGAYIDDSRLIILPAFNDLVGGISVNRLKKRLMGPLLRSQGVNLDTAEVYLIDGTFLGTIQQIQHLAGEVKDKTEA